MSEYTSRLQRQIESLSAIIELWVPVLEEMKTMQRNLEELPVSLEQLKQQLAALDQDKLHQESESETAQQLQEVNKIQKLEPKLRNSVNNLEAALPQLAVLEKKIRNLIALKERLEALQENVQSSQSPNYAAEFAQLQHSKQNLTSHKISAAEADLESTDEERRGFNQVSLDHLSPVEENAWLQLSLAESKRQHRFSPVRPRQSSIRRTSMWLGITLFATVLISFGTVILVKHSPVLRETTDQTNLPSP